MKSAPSVTPQHDVDLTFCLDETNGCPTLKKLLESKGVRVELVANHRHLCGPNDVDWLPYVSERRWIILSRDNKIRKCKLELECVKNSKARMFVFRSHNLSAPDLLEVAERSFKKMLRVIAETDAPFVGNVVRSGDIRLIPLGETIK